METAEFRAMGTIVLALAFTCREQLGMSLDDFMVRLMASCSMLDERGEQATAQHVRAWGMPVYAALEQMQRPPAGTT